MAKPSSSQSKREPAPAPTAQPAALKAAPPGSAGSGDDEPPRSNKVARGFGSLIRDFIIATALAGAGRGAALVMPRIAGHGITCAVARGEGR